MAKAHDDLSGLSQEALKKYGLKDATLRVALPAGGKYHRKAIKPYTWLRGRDERADTCIFRLIGIVIPPLTLHSGSFILGGEVGLIGFPLGNALQGPELRPVVTKTVLAGVELTLRRRMGCLPGVLSLLPLLLGGSAVLLFSPLLTVR